MCSSILLQTTCQVSKSKFVFRLIFFDLNTRLQVTVKNLKVALVDTENGVIGVTGAVPGPRKGIVIIKEAK